MRQCTQCVICSGPIPDQRGGSAITCCADCGRENARRKQRGRRVRYQGTCVDCGRATDGSGGYGRAAKRCMACHAQHMHESRHWTRERIVASMHTFVELYGRIPSSADIYRRHRCGLWPAQTVVDREFGSWNGLMVACGWEPVPVGSRRKVAA